MKKRPYITLLATAMLLACDAPEDVDDIIDDVEFREVYPCAEYNSLLPADGAPMEALFSKVGVIRDVKVVEQDLCRTSSDSAVWTANSCPTSTRGRWSFWHLMTQMAGSNDPSAFILTMLDTFQTQPVVNGFQLEQRPGWKNKVVDKWRQNSGCALAGPCTLDPKFTPFRLAAIVNRMDLRPDAGASIPSGGYGGDNQNTAGEGRFVFTVLDDTTPGDANPPATPVDAQIILEYALPTTVKNRVTWATEWLALNNYDWNAVPTSPTSYQSRLQALTDAFVSASVMSTRPNSGSAINTVRTNEKAFDAALNKKWSMRQFKLGCVVAGCSSSQNFLVPTPVDLTPDTSFIDSDTVLVPFMDQNKDAILAGTHTVPLTFNDGLEDVSFLGGESKSPSFAQAAFWAETVVGLLPDQANAFDTRHLFGMGTCNGCHYKETENEVNVHIGKKVTGSPSALSAFLQGALVTTVPIGDGSSVAMFNEPRRRMCELRHTKTGAAAKLTTFFGGAH